MLKQQFQLKLSQKLSPQQIQLMKMIQLTTLDFEQRLQNEIEENPALEDGKKKSTSTSKTIKMIMRIMKPSTLKTSISMRI